MTPEPPKPLPKPQAIVKPKKAADYQPPPVQQSRAPASYQNEQTVRFQSDVDLLTTSGNSYSQFASPPRRAADYQPPDSFLQNMDRPVKENVPTYKGGMGSKTNDVLGDLWKV